MPMIACKRCGELKPATNFHKKAESKTGRQSYCKVCSTQAGRRFVDKRAAKLRQAKDLLDRARRLLDQIGT